MTELSAVVHTNGIAKNKILVTLGVFGAILISALMFGVFTSNEDKKTNMDESIAVYRDDNLKNTDQLLQDALAKERAESIPESHIVLPVEAKAIQMVPPINKASKEASLDKDAQAAYDKQQLSQKYAILSAKSLMYTKAPAAINNTQSGTNLGESIPEIQSNRTTSSVQSGNASGTASLASGMVAAKSPYEVMAGSIIPATMLSGLNSDIPGQVIAQVRENVYDSSTGKYLLIPQGARLIGLYDSNIIYGQERILVAWNRLIYGDGSSINLKAMPGTDLEGYTGFYDEVDNKYWKIFGSSFILGVITGAMQYSQNNTNANVQVGGIGVTTNNNPTVSQTLSGSLGQQLGQTGLALTQKNLNVQPTLIVKPNYPFNIMITADMVLRPLAIK